MLLPVLLLITALFALGLFVKRYRLRRLCALCVSISGSWLLLLTLTRFGNFHNPTLLALLMGQSVTGIFYLVQRHVAHILRIFTLPFFLSLTVLADWAAGGQVAIMPVLGFLLVLWLAAYILFSWRHDPGKQTAVQTVMKCCEEN